MTTPSTTNTLTLTLHATIPLSRHTQLLHILSGVSGHPPVPVLESHLLFRPASQAVRSIAADEGGGTQKVVDKEKAKRRAEREARERGQGRGIVRFVEEVEVEGFGEIEHGAVDVDGGQGTTNGLRGVSGGVRGKTKWSRRFYDTPDPTVRVVTARKSEVVDVMGEVESVGEACEAAEGMGYRYIVTGSQFVYSNIILLLHKPLLLPNSKDERGIADITEAGGIKASKPLDPSDAYVLEVRLELLDEPGNPPSNDLMSQGMKEMARFKEMMKGCVEFKTVERMSMNTRI